MSLISKPAVSKSSIRTIKNQMSDVNAHDIADGIMAVFDSVQDQKNTGHKLSSILGAATLLMGELGLDYAECLTVASRIISRGAELRSELRGAAIYVQEEMLHEYY